MEKKEVGITPLMVGVDTMAYRVGPSNKNSVWINEGLLPCVTKNQVTYSYLT